MGHHTEALNFAELRVLHAAMLMRLFTGVCEQKQPFSVQMMGLHHAFRASLDRGRARFRLLRFKACSRDRDGELSGLIDGLEQLSSFLDKDLTSVHVLAPRLRDSEGVGALSLRDITPLFRCLPVDWCRGLLQVDHIGIEVSIKLGCHFKFRLGRGIDHLCEGITVGRLVLHSRNVVDPICRRAPSHYINQASRVQLRQKHLRRGCIIVCHFWIFERFNGVTTDVVIRGVRSLINLLLRHLNLQLLLDLLTCQELCQLHMRRVLLVLVDLTKQLAL